MTTVTRPAPHHDKLTCVKDYGCRRTECLARAHAYERSRYRRKAYGTWQPFADAEPVRQHIQLLRDHGMSFVGVHTAAGIASATLARILYGEGGNPPGAKVRTDTAQRILAVSPADHTPPDGRCIDATSARRRIQALVAIGWPMKRLGRHLGRSEDHMRQAANRTRITAANDRLIRGAYRQLWDRNPAEFGISPAAILRAKRLAAERRWAPPAAWDNIDDPRERPKLGTRPPGRGAPDMAAVMRALEGERLQLSGLERTAAIELGIRRGLTYEAIAAELDIDEATVKRTWERVKERARTSRKKTETAA